MMKAKWITDYDSRTDRLFDRPGCPDCKAPIGKYEDGYHCFLCDRLIKVSDPEMIKWLDEREETMVKMEDCPKYIFKDHSLGCGGKECVETHYVRNNVTLEWQVAWGECRNCGMRFIV